MVFGGFEEPKRRRPRPTKEDKAPHYSHQGGKCNGCKRAFNIENMEMDHKVKPFSAGGGERTGNQQLLCGNCNRRKGTGTMKQLEKKLIADGTIKALAKPAAKPAKKAAVKPTAKAKRTAKPGKKKPTQARGSAASFEGLFGL